jgi:hypothetical protein
MIGMISRFCLVILLVMWMWIHWFSYCWLGWDCWKFIKVFPFIIYSPWFIVGIFLSLVCVIESVFNFSYKFDSRLLWKFDTSLKFDSKISLLCLNPFDNHFYFHLQNKHILRTDLKPRESIILVQQWLFKNS